MNPRYRQAGYGVYDPYDALSTDWRAVWLDAESVKTGRLVFYMFPDGRTPYVYTGPIYQTLADCPAVHK